MNKSELVYEVTNRLDVTRKEAEDVIDCFLELIAENLANGDKVVLSGFGTFEIRNRVSRSGVNPGKILKDKLR